MRWLYRQRVARLIALAYAGYLLYYLAWRATSTLNPDGLGLSVALLLVESSSVISFSLFALTTWDVSRAAPFRLSQGLRVDVYVPTYNEDVSILEATLVGCNAIRYPHQTYVLDDGRRPEVARLARQLGCGYLTRPDNAHAKAGNLNAALARTTGEFIVVLDADTVPQADFLDRTLGYFCDSRLALVQLPQEFYNLDSVQHARSAASAAAWHEQELFYRVIQPGKNRWNASFWCGSPSVLRRSALADVGGVATGSITEDLQTTLRLHARGWRTVYHPEPLAFGIAAQTLHAFAVQRLRWAQGTMQLLRSRENPLFLPGLTLPQRLSHLGSMITYLEAYQKLAYLLAPPLTLICGVLPVRVGGLDFLVHWLPYFGLGLLANTALGRGSFRYLLTEQYNLLKMFTFISASAILVWPRPLRFRVTPKQAGASAHVLERRQLAPHVFLLLFIGFAVALGLANLLWGLTTRYTDPLVAAVTAAWGIASAALLGFSVHQVLDRLHHRNAYRFGASLAGALISKQEPPIAVTIGDLSVNGGSVHLPSQSTPSASVLLVLELPDGPLAIPSEIVHDAALADGGHRLGVRFRGLGPRERERLVEFLFVTLARYQASGSMETGSEHTEPAHERRAA